MKILLIEDDYWFGREIIESLEAELPVLRGAFETISAEKEFRERFSSSQPLNYDCIILDIMLQWGDPSSQPEDVVKGGYFQAGVRCLKVIREAPATQHVPVIIHSARDSEKITSDAELKEISLAGTTIVAKSGDPLTLVEHVSALLSRPSPGRF
jgi:DNA-binding response OmpR family regulator